MSERQHPAASEACRIDVIGQNGNDGLHYDPKEVAFNDRKDLTKANTASGICPESQDKGQAEKTDSDLSRLYPQYHKDVSHLTSVDVYAVHQLFRIDDPSGCIQHASKKLLLSGVRTGGKSKRKDITEARDTLTRWLELNND